jgi:hypothetical protein
MKKRIAALLMVMGFMLATADPVFAVPEGCPGGEMQPGQSGERARAPFVVPSEGKPGSGLRSASGDEHDTSNDATGRGEMCGGQI